MQINGFQDTIDWYEANAKDYAAKTDQFVRQPLIAQFAKLLPPGPVHVLDAGCGVGKTTRVLSTLGLDVTGVDITESMLEEAKKRAPELNFKKGDMRHLDFQDAFFAGIFAQASLVHLETKADVNLVLSEFNRVLKPGGILFFSVKAQLGDNETEVVSDKLSNHPRFFRYYTRTQISSMLKDYGFTILSSDQENETVQDPNGRPEVDWIFTFAKKST